MGRTELAKLLEKNTKAEDERELWIWGTGNTAEMFAEGFRRWKRNGQILGYVDNNPEKWGKTFFEKPVISPNGLKKRQNPFVLLCSNQLDIIEAVGKQLDAMELRWELLESFVLRDLKEEVLKVYDILADERSRSIYEYLVLCKMNGAYPQEESGLLDCMHGYFSLPEFEKADASEVFIDVGCFTGDTIEEYLNCKGNTFHQIYSFEPDKVSFSQAENNIKSLCERYHIERDRIHLFPYGVGGKTAEGVFRRFEETEGAGSKFVTGMVNDEKTETKIVALDDFLQDGFSLLKADVESYEYQVLLGAEKSIRKYRPKLAICLYHNTFDFIQIPKLVKQMVSDYKLYIRQHAASWYDTVLYATI